MKKILLFLLVLVGSLPLEAQSGQADSIPADSVLSYGRKIDPSTPLDPKLLHFKLSGSAKDSAGWQKIGRKVLEFTKNQDDILLIGTNRFSSLKITAADGALNLNRLVLKFNNGVVKIIAMNPILKGKSSNEIPLRKGKAELERMTFHYKPTLGDGAQSVTVEIWGYKAMVE